VLGIHLCSAYRVHHDGGGIRGEVRSACCRNEPVVVIGRHQYELAAPVPRDLNGFTLSLMLELAEFPLELQGSRPTHEVL